MRQDYTSIDTEEMLVYLCIFVCVSTKLLLRYIVEGVGCLFVSVFFFDNP